MHEHNYRGNRELEKMLNTIKHLIENGIKMAFAEQIGKLIRHRKRDDEIFTKEEKEKLKKMRKIKGDVKVLSPDYKQPPKQTDDSTTTT
jgi:hypothetical protein